MRMADWMTDLMGNLGQLDLMSVAYMPRCAFLLAGILGMIMVHVGPPLEQAVLSFCWGPRRLIMVWCKMMIIFYLQ